VITVAGQSFTLVQDVGGPLITKEGVVNAASFVAGPIVPGEIITIFGQAMGPETLASYELTADQKFFTTSIAGTRVLFGNTPAPMVYTSAGQVSAIVPYDVAGKTTIDMQVEHDGALSNTVTLNVAPTNLAIFTLDSSGKGQGAVLNQDYAVNGTGTNAATRGSTIMIFATGEGQTNPNGTDGKLAVVPLVVPRAGVTVQINGANATVRYAGGAPGLVAGVIQINAVIPANAPVGNAVPIVIRSNGVSSPAGVTIGIR
jgi:uncharacterized protein (TIGR03437 family)